MKHALFFGVLLVGLLSKANGQFSALFIYGDCANPLTLECIDGDPIPDGASLVELFQDLNNSGPDSSDPHALTGPSWDPRPYNFPINGLAAIECPGTFLSQPAYTIPDGTPLPARYWLRICNHEESTIWISRSLTIENGFTDIVLDFGMWMCYDSICGGCQSPPAIEEFAVSDTNCDAYYMSWLPYSGPETVDSLFLYRISNFAQISQMGVSATEFIYTQITPPIEQEFMIRARKVCGPDSFTFSNDAIDIGHIAVPPPRVITLTASDTIPEYVTLTWSGVAEATGYQIYRNGDRFTLFESPETTYNDNTAVPNVVYIYAVSAVDHENPLECREGAISESDTGARPSSIDVGDVPGELARAFSLAQNHPNPFNAETTIEFEVPTQTRATLELFDITGRHARTLFDDITNGRNSVHVSLNGLASGIYIYRLNASGYTLSHKMLLIR